jgi:hypothetical protein
MRLCLAPAVLAITGLAVAGPVAAEPQSLRVGDTLACISADPSRHIRVVVGRVDTLAVGVVISISLYAAGRDGSPMEAAHLPVELGALQKACPGPAAEPKPVNPDFEGGYATWRSAFDAHRGGFFTIGVDEIIDIILQNMPHDRPPGDAT